jgi:hypothetical protein
MGVFRWYDVKPHDLVSLIAKAFSDNVSNSPTASSDYDHICHFALTTRTLVADSGAVKFLMRGVGIAIVSPGHVLERMKDKG